MELNPFVIGLILVVLVIFVGAIAAYGDDMVRNDNDTSDVVFNPRLDPFYNPAYEIDLGVVILAGGIKEINLPIGVAP